MRLVLDTNVVLDLLVFRDPATAELAEGLASGAFEWLATAAMRDELARVLAYPKIAPRVTDPRAALARYDEYARMVAAPAKAGVTCGDADDQKFIDLAVAHRCLLLSKDAEVLKMGKRLVRLDVTAAPTLAQVSGRRPATPAPSARAVPRE